MVESVTCYGCEVWLLKRRTKKTISCRNGLFKEVSQSVQIGKKSQTSPLGAKCKKNNQFQTEFKDGNQNGTDTSLEWKIVVGQRRFTSGHYTIGGEEEDYNNHGGIK